MFFFERDADHRDLHSFPTRRSSDLHALVPEVVRDLVHLLEPAHDAPLQVQLVGDPRSEEHTSELQSPVHLVCRLLLEKKKELYLPILEQQTMTSILHISKFFFLPTR